MAETGGVGSRAWKMAEDFLSVIAYTGIVLVGTTAITALVALF
jgi:hypothetical protein